MRKLDPFATRYDTQNEIGALVLPPERRVVLAGEVSPALELLRISEGIVHAPATEMGFIQLIADLFIAIGRMLADIIIKKVADAFISMLREQWVGFDAAFQWLNGIALEALPADSSAAGLLQLVNGGEAKAIKGNWNTQFFAINEFIDTNKLPESVSSRFGKSIEKLTVDTFGTESFGHPVEVAAESIAFGDLPSKLAKELESAVSTGDEIKFIANARKAWALQAGKGDVRGAILLVTNVYEQKMMSIAKDIPDLPSLPVTEMVNNKDVPSGIPAMALVTKRLTELWKESKYIQWSTGMSDNQGPKMIAQSHYDEADRAAEQLDREVPIVGRWLTGTSGLPIAYRRLFSSYGIEPNINAEGKDEAGMNLSVVVDGKYWKLPDLLRKGMVKSWWTRSDAAIEKWRQLIRQLGLLQESENEYAKKYNLDMPAILRPTVEKLLSGTTQSDWIEPISSDVHFVTSAKWPKFVKSIKTKGWGFDALDPEEVADRIPDYYIPKSQKGVDELKAIIRSGRGGRMKFVMGYSTDTKRRRRGIMYQGWKNLPHLMPTFIDKTFGLFATGHASVGGKAMIHPKFITEMKKQGAKFWSSKNNTQWNYDTYDRAVRIHFERVEARAAAKLKRKLQMLSGDADLIDALMRRVERKAELGRYRTDLQKIAEENPVVERGVIPSTGERGAFKLTGRGEVVMVYPSGLVAKGQWGRV